MFCQSCGFEYTQKTNYCKRCGGYLTPSDKPPEIQLSTIKIPGVFFVIAAFVLLSLFFVYDFYEDMIRREVRGPELFVPFILGLGLIGAVAGLLCWQLSRLITVARKPENWVEKQERPTFREFQPQGRLVAPADPVRGMVEPPSVVDHTTRQMAPAKLDID